MAQDDFYRGDATAGAGGAGATGRPGPGQQGWDQPSYGQQAGGWGPPGYGAPGHGYGYPPPQRPTNTLAILSLVLAFVFAPAGVVLGVIARRQISRTGEEGSGLALAGIIVGAVAMAFFLLLLVAPIIFLASVSSGSFAP